MKWENGVIPYKFEPSYGKVAPLRNFFFWRELNIIFAPLFLPPDRYPRKKAAILKLIAVMNKLLDGCLKWVPSKKAQNIKNV